jgi:hypothetical protein
MFRQCGIFDISQTYRPTRPVTGIDLSIYILFDISRLAAALFYVSAANVTDTMLRFFLTFLVPTLTATCVHIFILQICPEIL